MVKALTSIILTFFLFASAGFKFPLHLKRNPGSKESTRLTGFFRLLPTLNFGRLRFFPLIRFRTCSPPGAGSKPRCPRFSFGRAGYIRIPLFCCFPTAQSIVPMPAQLSNSAFLQPFVRRKVFKKNIIFNLCFCGFTLGSTEPPNPRQTVQHQPFSENLPAAL